MRSRELIQTAFTCRLGFPWGRSVGAVDKILMAIMTLGIAAEAGAQVKTVDTPPQGTSRLVCPQRIPDGWVVTSRGAPAGRNLNCPPYRGTRLPMTIQKLGPFDDGSWLRTVDVCDGVPSSDLPPQGYMVTETVEAWPPGSCGRLQYIGRWRTPPWRAFRILKLP